MSPCHHRGLGKVLNQPLSQFLGLAYCMRYGPMRDEAMGCAEYTANHWQMTGPGPGLLGYYSSNGSV
jgi:hypothetical protein